MFPIVGEWCERETSQDDNDDGDEILLISGQAFSRPRTVLPASGQDLERMNQMEVRVETAKSPSGAVQLVGDSAMPGQGTESGLKMERIVNGAGSAKDLCDTNCCVAETHHECEVGVALRENDENETDGGGVGVGDGAFSVGAGPRGQCGEDGGRATSNREQKMRPRERGPDVAEVGKKNDTEVRGKSTVTEGRTWCGAFHGASENTRHRPLAHFPEGGDDEGQRSGVRRPPGGVSGIGRHSSEGGGSDQRGITDAICGEGERGVGFDRRAVVVDADETGGSETEEGPSSDGAVKCGRGGDEIESENESDGEEGEAEEHAFAVKVLATEGDDGNGE